MKLSVALLLVSLAIGASAKPAEPVLGYQNTLGQYSFGYSAPFQARSEARSLDGVTRGSYSYVDGAGMIQSTDYTADGQNGFRVLATNLPQAPVPVQDTPEVAAARAAHLSAVEEAARAAEAPVPASAPAEEPESASAPIAPKIAEPSEEIEDKKEEPQPAEPIVESRAAEDAAGKETQEGGRAIGQEQQPAVAPVIASAAATLPVPLIPVNFDLPSISAYTGRPAGAKAEQTLPQSTPAQGITPAGTALKSLPAPQLVPVAPRVSLVSQPIAPGAPEAVSGRAIQWAHYPIARAGFAPTGPVNIIPLGYDPSIPSFYGYVPSPYVAYNVL